MIKGSTITLTFLLLFVGCGTNTSVSINQSMKGIWSEIKTADSSSPIARHEAAFVGVGKKLVLVGGRRIQPVSIYDVTSNQWSTGEAPPLELHHFQPIVYKNEIYILGALTGQYPGETPVDNIYIYNPETDNWRKGPAIPNQRLRGGAGVILDGHKIYLVCGIKDGHRGDHKKWLDSYDLKSGVWTIHPDAPRARDHFQSVLAGNKIYNLGGRTTIAADNPFKNTIGAIDVFDIKKNEWTTLPYPLPTLRAGNFNVLVGDEILVLGGESFEQNPAHSEVEALNIHTYQWRSLPPMPVGRHGSGAVFQGKNKIYTASGSGNKGGGPELSDTWVFLL